MAVPPQPLPLPPAAEEGAAPAAPLPVAPPGPRPYEVAVAAAELRPVDCNLAALCDHVQAEGFGAGAFSDVVVEAMGATYRLHRLILSRSAYFRNMLHGPWREAGAPTVVLQIDDPNVDSEAIAISLAYLYGQPPKLNDNNAFRVLAAASFLDLQDLCTICTDFIISELWTSNFLQYQLFAESQDYGSHGERVRNACWGYLCQSATQELREVLPKLSSQTLHALLTSDELWIPNEEKRFDLALFTLVAKVAMFEPQVNGNETCSSNSDCSMRKGKAPMNESFDEHLMETELQNLRVHDNLGSEIAHNSISISDMNVEASKRMGNDCSTGGPSGESTSYQFNGNIWLSGEQTKKNSFSRTSSDGIVHTEWGRPNAPLWGGRIVGRPQARCITGSSCLSSDEYNAFMNIFERGSLLYCNMSFDALLSVRKQLEEFGFPCKAVNDGLWLQMLLCHRVQAIVADTCRNCCLTSNSCACKQAYVSSHAHYRQEHDRSSASGTIGNVYLADAQGDGNGVLGPVRVNVRGAVDGLAGIGRGNSNVPGAAWAPTRYVFSRVPYGLGSRNGQQFANDESEPRIDRNGDISADGLTALVNLSQENHACHQQAENLFESGMQTRYSSVASVTTPGGSSVQMQESKEHELGSDWETAEDATISLDMKTPLSHFPPFRFGVEFEDVHRLGDGQVKHSAEVFYAGSLWKVSVQAFNDEDPHGRRTLGLFLHRRKAELLDPLRKAHMYVDPCEKVTARYQLICPSKREVMVFGSLKQAGTLLPKAPKGWGWRTAILFDELAELLQGGALRIAAVVQLV